MKKVGVLTFCTWTSIGSILQSFALKNALVGLDYHSEYFLNKKGNEFHKTKIRSTKTFIKRLFQSIIQKKRMVAHSKRCAFIENNINVKYYNDYKELESIDSSDLCCYIAGSDQIWHPDKCYKHFFLDFAENIKRVSYAASMGKEEIPGHNRELFKNLLNNFDVISVREKQCKDQINTLTDKPISVNIDPTFLMKAEEWKKYETPYNVKGPYILLYMIYWDKTCINKIKKLKKLSGLPVFAICSGLSRVYADKCFYDVGVGEFLWLIDNAEYVVTSSFHGVALSIIFNKRFSPLINPDSPSRIRNLLEVLSVPYVEIDELYMSEVFNYSDINARIIEEQKCGMKYLKEAIE